MGMTSLGRKFSRYRGPQALDRPRLRPERQGPLVTELSRRQILKGGAALGLLAASGGLLAACATATSSTAGGSAVPANETTLQRMKRTGVARVGFTNEAPFSIAEPDKTTGIDPDIMRAFLATQNVTTEDGVLMEFGSLIPALLADRIDVITAGIYLNPKRCESIAFSNPSVQIGQAFAVKKGNPLNLHSYKDVATKGARFGANTGGLEFGWADAAGIAKDKQVQFPDLQTSIAALQADRVDCISNNAPAIADLLKKLGDPNLEMAVLTEQPVDTTGKASLAYSGFGFRKEDTDFVDAFNKWLAASEADGTLLGILTTYGLGKDEIPPADVTSQKICAG
jgi:polar amino acid transport system substrate-binding protein